MIEQVIVPDTFFTKALKEYSNWKAAWFREALQNAIDAGATRIDTDITEMDGGVLLHFNDNGVGMTEETLRNAFFTLGGSFKDKDSVGGFGYAKTLLCFAWPSWTIQTGSIMCEGTHGRFEVRYTDTHVQGVSITVWLPNESAQDIWYHRDSVLSHLRTNVQVYVDGLQWTPDVLEVSETIDTPLGRLSILKNAGYSELYVRIGGIPMLRIWNTQKFSGYLDMVGKSTEVLTANRDGLKSHVSTSLNTILTEYGSYRSYIEELACIDVRIRDSHSYASKYLPAQEQDPCVTTACLKSETLDREIQEARDMRERAIQQLTNINFSEYPIDFYVQVSKIDTNFKNVLHELSLQRLAKTAKVWDTVVRAMLPTVGDTSVICGFTFDETAEAKNSLGTDGIYRILLNTRVLSKDWTLEDLIDLAAHELAHIAERNHNEDFVMEDFRIRKEFRRCSKISILRKELNSIWVRRKP